MGAGIRSVDLPRAVGVDTVIGNYRGSTVVLPIDALARLLASELGSDAIYEDAASGLAHTEAGQQFRVAKDDPSSGLLIYVHSGDGSARLLVDLPTGDAFAGTASAEELDVLRNEVDVALEDHLIALRDSIRAKLALEHYPGRSPTAFGRDLAGTAATALDAGAANLRDVAGLGTCYLMKAAQVLAPRASTPIIGEVVEVTWRLKRVSDPTDPSNHTVDLRVAYLDAAGTILSTSSVELLPGALVSDGVIERSERISPLAVDEVRSPPSGAVAVLPYVQTFGDDGETAVHLIRAVHVTDLHSLSATDLSQLVAQLNAAIASAQAASLTARDTLDTFADLAGYDRPADVAVVTIKGGQVPGDALGGDYVYLPSDTSSTTAYPLIAETNDGSRMHRASLQGVFASVGDLVADAVLGYSSGRLVGAGDRLRTGDGRPVEVAAASSTDWDFETQGGIRLYDLTARSSKAAEVAANLPDGSVVWLDGLPYSVDSGAVAGGSATSDLGIDGLVPYGSVRPGHFGLRGDGSDEGQKLNAMFSWVAQAGAPHVIDFGELDVGTTVPIVFGLPDLDTTKLVVGVLRITALAEIGAGAAILTIQGEDQVDWQAHTYVSGGGEEEEWDTWLADIAVEMIDCRHISVHNMHVSRVRRWGLKLQDAVGDGRIQSFFTLHEFEAVDCGHRYGGDGTDDALLTADPTRVGTQFSNNQTSEIVLDAAPDWLEPGDHLVLPDPTTPSGLYPHIVTAISGNTVTIFPWAHASVISGAAAGFIAGGGALISGNDSNVGKIGRLRATRCAVSLLADHSYNLSADRVYSQHCSIPLQVGALVSGSVRGMAIESFGSESSTTFGPVMRTRAAQGVSMQGYPVPVWIGQHRARGSDETFSRTVKSAKGVERQTTVEGPFQQQWNRPRNYLSGNASTEVLQPGPKSTAVLVDDDPNITLRWNEDRNEQFGYGHCTVLWTATDKGNADNLTVILDATDAADGWTIDYESGAFTATTLEVSDPGRPVVLHLVAEVGTKRWIVVPIAVSASPA